MAKKEIKKSEEKTFKKLITLQVQFEIELLEQVNNKILKDVCQNFEVEIKGNEILEDVLYKIDDPIVDCLDVLDNDLPVIA